MAGHNYPLAVSHSRASDMLAAIVATLSVMGDFLDDSWRDELRGLIKKALEPDGDQPAVLRNMVDATVALGDDLMPLQLAERAICI
jgi:hypothetical protein